MASRDQTETFFQALFWAAWGDDALLEVEQKILADLLSNAGGDGDSLAKIRGWFVEPPDEPNWDVFDDDDINEALIRDIAMVMLVDGVVNLDEMEQLEHVRTSIGMSETVLHRILKDAEAAIARAAEQG